MSTEDANVHPVFITFSYTLTINLNSCFRCNILKPESFSAPRSYFEELSLTKTFEVDILKKDPEYLQHVGLFSVISDQILSNFDFMGTWNGDNLKKYLETIGFTQQGAAKLEVFILNGICHISPRCSIIEYVELHHRSPVPIAAATFPVKDEFRGSSFEQSFSGSPFPDKKIIISNLTGRQNSQDEIVRQKQLAEEDSSKGEMVNYK
jgi:hypothetical protein